MHFTLRIFPTAICGFVLSAVLALAAPPRPAWVTPSVLNVRQSRGMDTPKVGTLTRGTKVYVTAFNDRWCQISYDGGKRGWAAEWLLQLSADEGRKLAAEAAKQPASSPASPPAWVNVPGARIRSGSGTGYRQITSAERGTKVYVIGHSGDWRKVKLPSGTVGWILGDLLETNVAQGQKLAAAPPAPTVQARLPKAFVNGDDVNVRTAPAQNARPVDLLDRGTTVWVIDTGDEWLKVKYGNGKGGWIAGSLLKYAQPQASPGARAAQPASEPGASAPPPSEPPLESMYGWVAEPTAHLRYGPGMQFDVKREVPEGTKVTVLDVEGHWCKVRVGPQEYGWIAAWCVDFLGPGNRVFAEDEGESVQVHAGWTTASTTTLRSGPGTQHNRVTSVPRGTEVVILDNSGDWYQVALSDNKVGWVGSSLIGTREEALARGLVPQRPGASTNVAQRQLATVLPSHLVLGSSATADFGKALARTALQYLSRGIRYVWGGSDPARGFDCSGFVRHVLSTCGVSLPHNASQQFNHGAPVSSGTLRTGDLVFFRNTGRGGISHVGIYIGGGQFVHSSSARGGMVVSTLRTGYYAHQFAGARRIR